MNFESATKILIISFLFFAACSKDEKSKCPYYMPDLDGRTPSLIIGDSISLGYTPTVVNEFPEMQVIHNECNAMTSTHGVGKIKSWTSHASNWKFCTINHGLWDISDKHLTNISEYISNLEFEVNHLKTVCDHVLFANTTRVPEQAEGAGHSRVDLYNSEAESLMTRLGVSVCDLNSVSESISHLHVNPSDIHYTEEGYKILGQALTQCIKDLI